MTLRHHFEPENNARLSRLCGPLDAHLRRVEQALQVRIVRRGAHFELSGEAPGPALALEVLKAWWSQADRPLEDSVMTAALAQAQAQRGVAPPAPGAGPDASAPAAATGEDAPPALRTRRTELRGRTPNQVQYLRQMLRHDVTFGIGPAGTGKTFLAVAAAVDALERQSVQRLVLTRPAVEAGERLGFLPGDLAQKVDPYLRPLYDALYDLMGLERVGKAFERGLIEIAPLAFMRGRTLNHAFVILDEAQNTTREQMKMFLTRLGFGSRCVVTGDTSQIDLPAGQVSGLVEAREVLQDVEGIGFTHFTAADVVRHPLVARIVEAYERQPVAAPAAGRRGAARPVRTGLPETDLPPGGNRG